MNCKRTEQVEMPKLNLACGNCKIPPVDHFLDPTAPSKQLLRR